MDSLIAQLYVKEDLIAYRALLELEEISDRSERLYPYLEQFVKMLESDRSYVRVRGFRLLSKQAKWDEQEKIASCIDQMLSLLDREKASALRQYLQALVEIVHAKPSLSMTVRKKVLSLDLTQYKDSVRSLIEKDIQCLLQEISE